MGELATSLLRLAGRNWPFANGAGRLVDRFGKTIDFGPGKREAVTSDGFRMVYFGDDHIGRHIELTGGFDRSGPVTLLAFASPGDTMVDVGANIGYVACLLLKNVPGSKVICFEPQVGVIDLLRENLAQFDDDRSRVREAGLSDTDGTIGFHIDTVNRGASSVVTGENADATIQVLDAARVFAELEALDLLKLDIEGHEAVVLERSCEEIGRLQPKAVLYEDNARLSGPGQRIGRIWEELDYELFGVAKSLFSTKLERVTAGNAARFHDFLAVSATRAIPDAARKLLPSGSRRR